MFCTCSRIWSISTFSSTAMLLVRASTAFEHRGLVFPAPDGAARMNRVPRTGPVIGVSGFGMREYKSRPQHNEANRNRFCESRIPNSQSRLLNVLHLLADLVDQHLQLHRDVAGARVDGFRAQGVGFAVELLQQEVQAAADRLFLGEDATDLDDVAVEAGGLLVGVEVLQP